MKKIYIFLTISLCFIFVNAKSLEDEYTIEFGDVTTKNFISKAGYLPLASLKQVCSYDYCAYVDGKNIKKGLQVFLDEYLETIPDEDVKASLRIKGVKITKIVMYN